MLEEEYTTHIGIYHLYHSKSKHMQTLAIDWYNGGKESTVALSHWRQKSKDHTKGKEEQ